MQQLTSKCIQAVQAEMDAASRGRGSERSIHVVNGRFQRTADERHIYLFSVTRDLPGSYDDAPVKLVVSGQEIPGSVVGLGEFEVTVALDDYLGKHIAEADLIIDLTFILKKLKEVLQGREQTLQTHRIARKAMGIDRADVGECDVFSPDAGLSPVQQAAIRKCLGSDFLMIWGPPGTGKTHVLARLLREEALAGRTSILLSNTNIAVDQALANFLKLCDEDDKLNLLFQQGKFVRLGAPQMKDADSLLLDKVVEKLNADTMRALEEKRNRLEPLAQALAQTERQVSHLRHLIQRKADVEHLKEGKDRADRDLSAVRDEERRVSTDMTQAQTDLASARQKRGLAGFLAKLSESRLEAKIRTLTQRSADIAVRVQRAASASERAEQAWRSADSEFSSVAAEAAAPGLWPSQLMEVERLAEKQKTAVDTLRNEIKALEGRLSGVRDQVLRDALLIACTCAKSTLDKIVNTRQFDTVVVDESSMVSLPQALWCASLAEQKLLVFGDFRQLPPISQIEEKDDPTNYRVMHNSIFEHNGIGATTAVASDWRIHMLDEQRRMPEQVCELVSLPMYEGRLRTHASVPHHAQPLTIIDTSSFNAWSDKTDGYSWFNWHHAFVVVELVRQLKNERPLLGSDEARVLVLAPYRAQVEVTNALLKEARLDDVAYASTVWRSQGREGEAVILDTVCAPPFTKPGRWFLDDPGSADGARLFNVAVTRTKGDLYLIAHANYLRRGCPTASLAALILAKAEAAGKVVDSRDLTRQSLPVHPDPNAGCPVLTFPAGLSTIFNADGFLQAFAADLDSMPAGGTITIFSPFLNETSVAHWGPGLRRAIERGCRVEVLTRKPGQQTAFQTLLQVDALISELEQLGAIVGYDSYIPGRKPMHHKMAILQFPRGSQEPLIWKGSMNALGHYSSEELMDRTRSQDLYNSIVSLYGLTQLRAAMGARSLTVALQGHLQQALNAVCPTHHLPMRLKLAKKARYKSYFLSCPKWKEGCPTINVSTEHLNYAIAALGAVCTADGCEKALEARNGRTGMYIRCSDGHFVNLDL